MTDSIAVACLVGVVLLAGCGGGGDSGNRIPVANAGANQTVGLGTAVTLDGRASSDADGDVLAYRWVVQSAPAGSRAALSNPLTATPSFTTDLDGTYIFSLTVSDGKAESTPATVAVDTCGVAPAAAGRRSPLVISCG